LTAAKGTFYNSYKFWSGEISFMNDSDDPESSNVLQLINNLFVGEFQA